MLKLDLTYIDFDKVQKTTTHHFYLSLPELVRLETEFNGEVVEQSALGQTLQRLASEGKNTELFDLFARMIHDSIGVQYTDGEGVLRFKKTPEDRDRFLESMAYGALFLKMSTDADYAVNFWKGIMPADLINEAEKLQQTTAAQVATAAEVATPAPAAPPVPPTAPTTPPPVPPTPEVPNA